MFEEVKYFIDWLYKLIEDLPATWQVRAERYTVAMCDYFAPVIRSKLISWIQWDFKWSFTSLHNIIYFKNILFSILIVHLEVAMWYLHRKHERFIFAHNWPNYGSRQLI